MIYNHQLCLIDRALWPFAVKSISDWKNEYHPECLELRRDQRLRRLLLLREVPHERPHPGDPSCWRSTGTGDSRTRERLSGRSA